MRSAEDVVLLHGLVNRHRPFLDTLLNIWGSGHVYIIYTNDSNEGKKKVYDGNVIYTIGRNNGTAKGSVICRGVVLSPMNVRLFFIEKMVK